MTKSLDLITEFEEEFEVEKWTVNGLHRGSIIRLQAMFLWENKLYN